MTPDKIFLDETLLEIPILQIKYDGDIEYIRKDILMEWAKVMKRICKKAKPIEKAYQTVIDKIESL